jgi:D-glycero-D-manno-heptose 1,7-bisphosphate phosphatase
VGKREVNSEFRVPDSELTHAVFLDRDGVINECKVIDGKPFPPLSVSEFVVFPNVAQACRNLKKAGFILIIATNQPDVGRGTLKQEIVENIHAHMRSQLPIDRVEVCYHSGREVPGCDCRKPKPGMLLRAARELNIDLRLSWMVGDRWRDIDCGHAAGCRTILVDYNYDEALKQPPDFRVRSLSEAADLILRQTHPRSAQNA